MSFRAVILLALLPVYALGAEKLVVNGRLRVDAVNKAYMESEWESLRGQLEAYLKSRKPDSLPVHDRIAAYKYLGVIYAADSSTRRRAESDFFLLLDLSPDIEVADLYVSNSINEFFQEIKRKHRAQKEYEAKYDAFGFPRKTGSTTDPEPSKGGPAKTDNALGSGVPNGTRDSRSRTAQPARVDRSGSHAWIWWTAGTAALAGAGAYFYFAYRDPAANKKISADIVGIGPAFP